MDRIKLQVKSLELTQFGMSDTPKKKKSKQSHIKINISW
jgi:hypothetical protein